MSARSAHRYKMDSAEIWIVECKSIEDIKELHSYEFYNVLWIERKGNTAYRKALGRVWKNAHSYSMWRRLTLCYGEISDK